MQGIKPDVIVVDSLSQVADFRKGLVVTLLNTYSRVAPQLPAVEARKAKGITATEMLEQMAKCPVKSLGDSLLDAFMYGHGLIETDFSDVEKLTVRHLKMRGSNKSSWPMMYMWGRSIQAHRQVRLGYATNSADFYWAW